MTDERKARIQELRKKLANLSEAEKQELVKRGLVATVEGRTLSLHNTMLVYLQGNGTVPTVVGGFQQWKKAGRSVMKGQHGLTIWFPIGEKNDNGDVTNAERFYTATVFDISQTQPIGREPQPEPTPQPKPQPKPIALLGNNDIMKGWAIV